MRKTMPTFIYGTAWKEERTTELTTMALQQGFRAIDTANQAKHYQEALVGEALQAMAQQGITRDQLFLQTKFTPPGGQDHRLPYDLNQPIPDQVRASVTSSLEHLHTDYLDAYLLHGPYSHHSLTENDWQVWRTLEALKEEGVVHRIGISNVHHLHLKALCEQAKIKPDIIQNRCYAKYGWDYHVRQMCHQEEIHYQGFSLLTANPQAFTHPEMKALCQRLELNPIQIIFGASMTMGIIPLTGTSNPEHMRLDLQCEPLSAEDATIVERMLLEEH